MQIQTIRITSEPSHDNPEGFIVINFADFDPAKHLPFDDEAEAALASAGASGERVPTMAELLVARDQLLARERELNEKAAGLDEQSRANADEAQRLAALAAAGNAAPDFTTMSKDELQAALTAKGASFPAAANKTELIGLLSA